MTYARWNEESSERAYVAMVRKIPLLSEDELQKLSETMISGDPNERPIAQQKLIISYLPLVINVVTPFSKRYCRSLKELIACGNVGLVDAAKRYDPKKAAFSTWAKHNVSNYVKNHLMGDASMVRMGTTESQKRIFFNLNKTKRALGYDFRPLKRQGIEEVAMAMDVPPEDLASMQDRLSNASPVSLNAPIGTPGKEGQTTLMDMLCDEAPGIPEQLIEKEEEALDKRRLDMLQVALALVNPRDADIFRQRRLQEKPTTLMKLADQYGVSYERVRQIEMAVFKKVAAILVESEKNGTPLLAQEMQPAAPTALFRQAIGLSPEARL